MNKNKVSPKLLCNVHILKNLENKQKTIVFASNFDKTKYFFDKNKYFYTPYRFASCFEIDADSEDLSIFSEQDFIEYIYPNSKVMLSNKEKQIINLNRLSENKFLGQGQTICFIDTGIVPHFDFIFPTNRIVKFIDLINKQKHPYDDNGHGTFVSGIACGAGILSKTNIGFAPKSKIISIKALSKSGDSNSNTILDAMQWVYENHKAYNIGVVCMSFGADSEENIDPLSKGAEALWKRGIVVVAAAGNSGPNKQTIKSPGNNPNIITVGALDVSNMTIADFSSRGPTIYGHKPDLLAPAVDIVSCSNTTNPYTTMSGTSVATPIVAGICADIKSKYPNMTNVEIKNFLLEHCTKITGNIDFEGAGYLNFV
ncbi:MAG: S8 family serine peptidase [Clostridia bacterium]|nr:S8 family serine peptidase [Clostridia bacterium]